MIKFSQRLAFKTIVDQIDDESISYSIKEEIT